MEREGGISPRLSPLAQVYFRIWLYTSSENCFIGLGFLKLINTSNNFEIPRVMLLYQSYIQSFIIYKIVQQILLEISFLAW